MRANRRAAGRKRGADICESAEQTRRFGIPVQALRNCHLQKNFVKRCVPHGDISVFTLIRTDTTLDHSQKAEKVCYELASAGSAVRGRNKTLFGVSSRRDGRDRSVSSRRLPRHRLVCQALLGLSGNGNESKGEEKS